MTNKIFVIGDIHGRYSALISVLEQAKFDYENDKLIVLGDIVDGGYDTNMVVEELLKIKNILYIFGNHDIWFIQYMRSHWLGNIWQQQGGKATVESYPKGLVPVTQQEFFNTGVYYYIEERDGKKWLFVHGGFDVEKGVENTKKELLVWDRELIKYAQQNPIPGYEYVFIGHTATDNEFGELQPVKLNNLIMMDTGAGWQGVLSMMDVTSNDKKEWVLYQSNQQNIPTRKQFSFGGTFGERGFDE